MYCPSDVNSGFIKLVGPIQQPDLTSITVKSYPLSISFASRSTPPSLVGNKLEESTGNTCTYKGSKFILVDTQICAVTHSGYVLPGSKDAPVAEMILSFSASSSASKLMDLSGILMCVPIYQSGAPSHNDYLNQLVDPSMSTCNYTNKPGVIYSGGDYNQPFSSSLTTCVKSCCGDTNCLAYTYQSGKCYLKNSIPPLSNTTDQTIMSGTIDRNHPLQSNENKKDSALVPTIESIFYSWKGDTSQTSFAYKTCFETIDSNQKPTSKSLYVVVFPNGIHLTPATYQQLLLQLNGGLQPYMVPPAIRGTEATLRSYTFDDSGNKVPSVTSSDGIIYTTSISSCTDEFKNRFEYFTLPPRLPNSAQFNSEQCPYYKTTQYKCMPFDQLKDLSGAYVVPGNKTLDTILQEQENSQAVQNETNQSMSVETIEAIVGGSIGGVVVIFGAIALYKWVSSKYGD